jgi:hypothetical protein
MLPDALAAAWANADCMADAWVMAVLPPQA